jgi:catecholate siderophore receptor
MRCSSLFAFALTTTAALTLAPSRVKAQSTDIQRRDSVPRQLGTVVVKASRGRQSSYAVPQITSATKTDTPLRDTPQSVTIVTGQLIADQAMQNMADVVRYIPGVTMGQGEGHRDQPTIRGNSTTADFFVDGVRDDAQYMRDLYNTDRVEALKGSNAMMFGRGGGGGVINRVSKEASFASVRSLTLEGGSFDHKRSMLDVGGPLDSRFAARLNGMYERSGAFRDDARFSRYGINPTATMLLGSRTIAKLSYERFDDRRTVDRGVPSFRGGPSRGPISTFFGDPDSSYAWAHVHAASMLVQRSLATELSLRNRTRFEYYDKLHQNVFPGTAVDSTGTTLNLTGYSNAILRRNLFNQTDLTYNLSTGSVRQTLLVGAEVGQQGTDNRRETAYFGTATSLPVAFSSPTARSGVMFRQSSTDADNHVSTSVAATYLQDQITLSPAWQLIGGVRYERIDVRYHNNRIGDELSRDDHMVSPRVGLVFKPAEPFSFYSGFSVSYLPSAGDQFSSLTATTQTLEPERFTNREVGAKWDVRQDLSLTAALYELGRTNTSAPDPSDPTKTVQTGSQRTNGFEIGATGSLTSAWQVAAGWASQRAVITSTTKAAKAGATVPLVPNHTLSLWNSYQALARLRFGLGVVHQARSYAAIDNSVTLPRFTRWDAALFYTITSHVKTQLNVENVLDTRYYPTSQGNNNIMPGAPRTLRLSVTSSF